MSTPIIRWLVVGLLLALSAIGGGLAVSRFDHFADASASVREQPFRLADALLRAHHHVHALHSEMRDAILARDLDTAVVTLSRASADDAALDNALETVVADRTGEDALVGRLSAALAAWRGSRDRTAQLLIDNRWHDASFVHNTEGETRYRQLEAVLEEALEAERGFADRLRADADGARRAAEISMLAFTVLATGTVTAALLGVTMVLRTHRPLLRLRASLLALAGGDTAIAIPYTHKTGAIGAMARAMHCFRDSLIQRDAATRALEESQFRLSQAVEEAHQANSAKSRFLAAASHDLRQPMQALRLYLDTLDRRLADRLDRRVLGGALTALAAGEELLRNYMDLSVLESGIIRATPSELALGPLLDNLIGECAPVAREKGLDLRLVPTRAVVFSDPSLLARLLRNLLSNAIRYTADGRVLVGCRRQGQTLRVEVADTGIGIPPDQLEAVFEDFYQIGNPERDRTKGLGLGLSVVDRAARLLGHPVRVRSVEGKGSIFSVELPLVGWQDKRSSAAAAAA